MRRGFRYWPNLCERVFISDHDEGFSRLNAPEEAARVAPDILYADGAHAIIVGWEHRAEQDDSRQRRIAFW